MSENLDPYLSWLGIRDSRRPPHHYRLLGIDLYESDSDVIANAADRQMAHVRTFQTSKYSALSQRLLNELSGAKLCLLNAKKKADYDAQLHQELAPAEPIAEEPVMMDAVSAEPEPEPEPDPDRAPMIVQSNNGGASGARRKSSSAPLIVAAVVVLAAVGAIGVWASQRDSANQTAKGPDPAKVIEAPVPNDDSKKQPEEPKEKPPVEKIAAPEKRPVPEGQVQEYLGHEGPVATVALAANGAMALSGGRDHSIRVWDVKTGKQIGELAGHTAQVHDLAISGDGVRAISCGADRSVRLWDLVLRRELAHFDGHRGPVYSVSLSADGLRAASGGKDGAIRIWDLKQEEELAVLEGHLGPISAVLFAADGQHLISASQDGTVRIWEIEGGKQSAQFETAGDPVASLAITPNGDRVAYGFDDGRLFLAEVKNQRQIGKFNGHISAVMDVAFSAQGSNLFSASRDGTLRIWNARRGDELHKFEVPKQGFSSLALSSDGTSLLSGGEDASLRLWTVPEDLVEAPSKTPGNTPTVPTEPDVGLVQSFEGHSGVIHDAAFSVDGRKLASAGADGMIRVWDVKNGELLHKIEAHPGGVLSVIFVGEQLASGGADNRVKLWNLKGDGPLKTFVGHAAPVVRVRVSADGMTIVSADADKGVRVWDLAGGESRHEFAGVITADRWDFAADRGLGVSGGFDRTLRVWNVVNGQLGAKFELPGGWLSSIGLAPSGTQFAAGTSDGMLRIWDLEAAHEIRRCSGHTGPVWSVAFSPSGQLALSGGHDHTLRLWDLASGRQLRKFEDHAAPLTCVVFAPGGQYAASADRGASLRLWKLPKPETGLEPLASAIVVPVDRQAPPERSALTAIAAEVQKEYKAEYAKRGAAEKSDFAGQLLTIGQAEQDPAVRFFLLSEARDIAAACGDAEGAFAAVDALARWYKIDPWELKVELLTTVARTVRAPEANAALVQSAAAQADAAVEHDRYEPALKFSSFATRTALKANSPPLVGYSGFKDKQLKIFKNEYDRLAKFSERLAADPTDAEANLELAKFHCLVRGDWKRGLPMLALCPDPWARAARAELWSPSDNKSWRELGRLWSELASGETKPPLKTPMQVHVYDCYREALALLPADDESRKQAQTQLNDMIQALDKKVTQYLSALPETEVFVGYGTFGKGGSLGYVTPAGVGKIFVRGKASPNGLSMFPPGGGASHVSYGLFKQFRTFQAGAAIADSGALAELRDPITFSVLGDGKLLWKANLSSRSELQECLIDVTGVNQLELVVACDYKNNQGCQAVWVEPQLSQLKLK